MKGPNVLIIRERTRPGLLRPSMSLPRPQLMRFLEMTLVDVMPFFELDFSLALQEVGRDTIFRIANEARPGDTYLFARFLPNRQLTSYYAEAGNMRVRATMAGLTAIDGDLPPVGQLEQSKFAHTIAKIGGQAVLNEKLRREISEHLKNLLLRSGGAGNVTLDFMVNEVLNFTDKALAQPLLDTEEWLRGQAMVMGEISWEFADQTLDVDYEIPAENKLAARTGTDAYGGSTSKFWDDIVTLRRRLKRRVQAYIAHGDTIDEIIHNDANHIDIVAENEDDRTVTIRKRRTAANGGEAPETSAQYTVTLTAYDEEGELFDLENRGKTLLVPFMPRGKITAVGRAGRGGYIVGEGSTRDPEADRALGYTHVGPTVEGGDRLGRFARLYTPEAHPERLIGESVENVLPVLEAPDKVATATTEMS